MEHLTQQENKFNNTKLELFPHQKEATNLVLNNKKFALFMEVGTGKTFTALEIIRQILKLDNRNHTILIICPLSGLEQWKEAIRFWLDGYLHRVKFMLINPESAISKKNIEKVSNNFYSICIFDEAHKIKSKIAVRKQTPKIAALYKKLSEQSEYSIPMTGTPIANNYVDMYNILTNSGIKAFHGSYSDFVNHYFHCSMKENKQGRRYFDVGPIKEEKKEELKAIFKRFSYIKRQDECVDLPDKTFKKIYIDGMKNKMYKEVNKSIFRINDEEDTLQVLQKISKLHQLSNGFVYDDEKTPHLFETYKKKIKMLNDILEQSLENEEQAIIVYNFQQDKENIINNLKYEYTLDSEEFKTNKSKRVLLLQMQNCEAANLQFCKIMIYYSYNYSYLNFNQMNGRIYRMGQKRNVIYYMLIAKGTIEEKILDIIEHKKSIDDFIKDVKNTKEE